MINKLSDEELQIYEVAFHLGISFYELTTKMPYDEFLGWLEYFERRPIGWREDYRSGLQLLATGAKIKIEHVFPSIAKINEANAASSTKNLKRSNLFQFIKRAKGGDKIDE